MNHIGDLFDALNAVREAEAEPDTVRGKEELRDFRERELERLRNETLNDWIEI